MNNIEDMFFDKKDSGKIVYNARYSEADQPDDRGRWSRKVMYNNLCIAWINMIKIDDKDNDIKFHVTSYFPSTSQDYSNKSSIVNTYSEAQDKVELWWNEFLNKIK